LLERAIRLARESGATPVFVVLGANSEVIRASVSGMDGASVVMNKDWQEGVATSIQTGLIAIGVMAPDAAGALMLTCDQPRLTSVHLRALIDTFSANAEPIITASTYSGIIGIPAVFPCQAFPQLYALRGDKGARALLLKPPFPLVTLPFAGGEVDIDQAPDLAHLE
jgi:molybdenum cofactor cytidylyltransferase